MQLVLPLERVAVKKQRKAIWNIAVLVADFSVDVLFRTRQLDPGFNSEA
jgi:hypothetical protein